MSLADVFELEQVADDVWQAMTPISSVRSDIFGGQVAGQALRAAGLSVEGDHLPNSVHGYFLRRGRQELPLEMHVTRTRTGRTYATRHVDVRQEGKTIFAMLTSFHTPEEGREFDHPMPEGVPEPEDLPALAL